MSQGSADDPDEVTGLTINDVNLVRRTWAELIKNPEESGVTLLGTLLERFPEYIKLFRLFKDVPQSELKTHEVFRKYAAGVTQELNEIIDIIDDSALLVPHLAKVGYTHLRKRVTREAFLHFKQVILDVFSTIFQPEELAAWGKGLNVIFLIILSGLSAADQFEHVEENAA